MGGGSRSYVRLKGSSELPLIFAPGGENERGTYLEKGLLRTYI